MIPMQRTTLNEFHERGEANSPVVNLPTNAATVSNPARPRLLHWNMPPLPVRAGTSNPMVHAKNSLGMMGGTPVIHIHTDVAM